MAEDQGGIETGRIPELSITSPYSASGVPAEVEGTFVNGVLTAVTVTNQGSGYSSTNLPQVSITNIHKIVTSVSPINVFNENNARETLIS